MESKPPPSGVRDMAGSLRVLLVDDDEDTPELMALLLGSAGHVAHAANRGQDALSIARSFRPDVALIDIFLPDMSGYELVALLRELPELANCRFIAVTGYSGQAAIAESLNAGFHQHLTKPVSTEALLATVAVANGPATVAR